MPSATEKGTDVSAKRTRLTGKFGDCQQRRLVKSAGVFLLWNTDAVGAFLTPAHSQQPPPFLEFT